MKTLLIISVIISLAVLLAVLKQHLSCGVTGVISGRLNLHQFKNRENLDPRILLSNVIEQDKDFRCWNMSAAFGNDYTKALNHLRKETYLHNSHLNSVLKTKTVVKDVKCFEGHVGHYAEEAYLYWKLARLDFVKVVRETGMEHRLFFGVDFIDCSQSLITKSTY